MEDEALLNWLAKLIQRGIQIWTEEGKLNYRAPKNQLTPEEIIQLKKHKPELIRLLQSTSPLSQAQAALWFLMQLAPDNPAYNLICALRLSRDVNQNALQRTLQSALKQHPALRTRFLMRDGIPMQRIQAMDENAIRLNVIHTNDWSDDQIHDWIEDEADRSFNLNLSHDPVIRITLLNDSARSPVLVLVVHHIVADFWSLERLLNDLAHDYQQHDAASHITSHHITSHTSSDSAKNLFFDYVQHENQYLASPAAQDDLAYWKNQLANPLPILELPNDRIRPALQSFNGATCAFAIDDALAYRVHSTAQQQGITPFIYLLTVFQVWLYRHSHQDDVIIGAPVASRHQQTWENVVGYFINMLPVRANLSGQPCFNELLRQTHQLIVEALQHQRYPFSLLVPQLNLQRDKSRSPVFQVSFAWDQHQLDHATPMMGDALFSEVLMSGQRGATVDLILTMHQTGAQLSGVWNYNTALFDAQTIHRFSEHFQVLLTSVLDHPETAITALPMLSKDEQQKVLYTFNDTARLTSQNVCAHQLFEIQAEQSPDNPALIFQDQQLSYRELNQQANQLAHYLLKSGMLPGDLVAISVERGMEMVVGFLAILKAGGVYIPIDSTYPADRIVFILTDAAPKLLLTQHHLSLPRTDIKTICLDADAYLWQGQPPVNPATRFTQVTPSHLAYVIYTSGSTGKPKGVMIEHRHLVNLTEAQHQLFGVRPLERVLQFASMSFDASISEIMMTLCYGATLILASKNDCLPGRALLQTLHRYQVAYVTLPQSALALCESGSTQDPSIPFTPHTVTVAGEALPPHVASTWSSRVRLINAYGPTEATICATSFDVVGQDVSIGRPIANTRIYLLDQHQQPTPVGVTGELWIGGSQVARGYLHRPQLTAERFLPDPFSDAPDARMYKSGDLARWRGDGAIDYLGRNDFQVKVRGFRMELGEIESCLTRHGNVREAVVVAREDAQHDKYLVAYITVRDTMHLPSVAELRSHVQSFLPDYMTPAAMIILDALPLTSNGKLDRYALPEPNRSSLTTTDYEAPLNLVEQNLATIWQAVLGIERIGRHDDFFELGGHSLSAIRLMSHIEVKFGVVLPLASLFQSPTLCAVAGLLQTLTGKKVTVEYDPLVAIQPQGTQPPIYCVPGTGGTVVYLHALAAALGKSQPFFGLQCRGIDGILEPHTNHEAIVADYVKAIRAVRPAGSYVLAGHSFGGGMAFSIAQELARQGGLIKAVLIFDAGAPIHGRRDTGQSWLNGLAATMATMTNQALPWSIAELAQLDQPQLEAHIHQFLIDTGYLPAQTPSLATHGFIQVFKTNYEIHYTLTPTVTIPTVLFRAKEVMPGLVLEQDLQSDWGWNELACFTVPIIQVPGNHLTMLNQPNAPALAEAIQSALMKLN